MAFHDVRLDMDIERGARGGPAFRTQVTTLASGKRVRNSSWAQPLGSWDIAYGLRNMADDGAALGLYKIISFFHNRLGRFHSFRFRDWSDYLITEMPFGVGDGIETIFQLSQRYTDVGSYTFDRIITKPDQATGVAIREATVSLTEGVDYTVDYNTGLVTFTSAPANTAVIDWTGIADRHVSFDNDELDIDLTWSAVGSIPAIRITEERE